MGTTKTLDNIPAEAASPSASWGAVLAMTLCVFALIASEFMPVSLLTPIAESLHVAEGLVGDGIAISGALAVVTSLSMSTLASRMNRNLRPPTQIRLGPSNLGKRRSS